MHVMCSNSIHFIQMIMLVQMDRCLSGGECVCVCVCTNRELFLALKFLIPHMFIIAKRFVSFSWFPFISEFQSNSSCILLERCERYFNRIDNKRAFRFRQIPAHYRQWVFIVLMGSAKISHRPVCLSVICRSTDLLQTDRWNVSELWFEAVSQS